MLRNGISEYVYNMASRNVSCVILQVPVHGLDIDCHNVLPHSVDNVLLACGYVQLVNREFSN